MPLSLCEHFYHLDCLRKYLKSQIDDSKFPLHCPVVSCKRQIGDLDLKEVLSEELLTKYAAFSLSTVVDTQKDLSWCPTPDCKFAFVLSEATTELNCPLCNAHYCLKCKAPAHMGKPCQKSDTDENKMDDAFYELAKGQKFKQCPKCAFWVERSQGCNHMTCRCGASFCYECGGKYGVCACVLEARRQAQERAEAWRRRLEIRRA